MDNFRYPSGSSDVALVVGGDKIYVKRETLAAHSDYFRALFFGGFAEKNQTEISIGTDVTFDEMLTFVMLVSREGNSIIDDGNWRSMIRLANRFCVDDLRNVCCHFVAHHNKLSFFEKLIVIVESNDKSSIEYFLQVAQPSHCVGMATSGLLWEFSKDIQIKVIRRALELVQSKLQMYTCDNRKHCSSCKANKNTLRIYSSHQFSPPNIPEPSKCVSLATSPDLDSMECNNQLLVLRRAMFAVEDNLMRGFCRTRNLLIGHCIGCFMAREARALFDRRHLNQ